MIDSKSDCRPKVGILFPGEMGATIGRLLINNGYRVVTTIEGRSDRTAFLCREAGLPVLGSMYEVVQAADLVISLVTPGSALELAERYCSCLPIADRAPIFVDANSISPGTAVQIDQIVQRHGAVYVDAAIHGLAARLMMHGTIFLSGAAAEQVAALFQGWLKVRLLGEAAGRASMLKMLTGGMSKGLVSLFVELGLLARDTLLLEEFLECCREFYPSITEVLERLLPTFVQHAPRRGEEMAELDRSVRSLGLRPGMVNEAKRLITLLGQSLLLESWQKPGSPADVLPSLLELIYLENPLEVIESAGTSLASPTA